MDFHIQKKMTLIQHHDTENVRRCIWICFVLFVFCWPSITKHWDCSETLMKKTRFLLLRDYRSESRMCSLLSALGSLLVQLMPVLCVLSQSRWVHMCPSPDVSRMSWLFCVLHPLWFVQSICLLFCSVPWVLRGGIWCLPLLLYPASYLKWSCPLLFLFRRFSISFCSIY